MTALEIIAKIIMMSVFLVRSGGNGAKRDAKNVGGGNISSILSETMPR